MTEKGSPVNEFSRLSPMAAPNALILRGPGTNCDDELAFAFELAGARCERVHIGRLRENPKLLKDFQILALAGGFTYGDDVAAGTIFANQLATFFADTLREFRDRDKLILGVCNGFQILLKAGFLIQPDEVGPIATLAPNLQGSFEDRWVELAAAGGKCLWLKDIHRMQAPVAHGEGRFVCRAGWMLTGLRQSGQIALFYAGSNGRPAAEFPANPNGSEAGVAGVCDPTGRVLGLMPHPERNVLPMQHPKWTREDHSDDHNALRLFQNAVNFFAV